MDITEDGYKPLREGTRATVRQASLSGIANRYIDLQLPPGDAPATIKDGGLIATDKTHRGRPRPALQHLRRTHAQGAPRRLIRGYAHRLRRPRQGGQQGLALPEPVAGRVEPALPRAEPRHAAAQALHRQLAPSSSPTWPSARTTSPASSTISPPTSGAIGRQKHRSPTRDQPAAAVHAPREHDVREPAGDPRRPRPARRGVQARRQAAEAVPRRAAAAGAQRPADAARPRRAHQAPGREQRPDRADAQQHRRCATSRSARCSATARSARARSRPRRRRCARHAGARFYAVLRARPHRLVRRLQPHRHLRRPRRVLPRRPARQRVLVRRTAPSCRCRPKLRAAVFNSVASINQSNRCPGAIERELGRTSPAPDYHCDATQVPLGP